MTGGGRGSAISEGGERWAPAGSQRGVELGYAGCQLSLVGCRAQDTALWLGTGCRMGDEEGGMAGRVWVWLGRRQRTVSSLVAGQGGAGGPRVCLEQRREKPRSGGNEAGGWVVTAGVGHTYEGEGFAIQRCARGGT